MLPRQCRQPAYRTRATAALGFALLLTFSSNIGQTYFIALFAGFLRADLGLSHGGFGGLFMLATIASAATLVWLGKLADRLNPVMLAALTLAALAGSAMLLAGAESLAGLVIALFGLRLFGQGMTSHLAMTLTARWFGRERGRALGLTFFGYPAGEAVLPILTALLLGLFTWRWVWVGIAIAVVLVLLPVLFFVGRRLPGDGSLEMPGMAAPAERPSDRSWTRAQVLRDPRFYGLLPGLLAAPFMITGLLFHQLHLVEIKGWALSDFAACYPIYAVSGMAAALFCGWLVDGYGAIRLLPFYLLPLAAGLALLGIGDSIATAAGFMAAMGATAGAATILLGAALAELYGTAHLGAIRAFVVALKVLATALAPAALGWLIDRGVGIDQQATPLALLVVASALGLALLLPSLLRYPSRTSR